MPAYDQVGGSRASCRRSRCWATRPRSGSSSSRTWASFHGGMLFEDLGFAYLGPIDGHDIRTMRKYLRKVKVMDGPVLLHVTSRQGPRLRAGDERPGQVPRRPFESGENGIIPLTKSSSKAYTDAVARALPRRWSCDTDVAVITAAMCEETSREDPRRRSPTGSSTSGSRPPSPSATAGMARPERGWWWTSTARSSSGFDQIFQVAFQGCPSSSPSTAAASSAPTARRTTGLRPRLHADLPAHGRHGPRRRNRPDDRLRGAPRPDVDPLPSEPEDDRRRGPADPTG